MRIWIASIAAVAVQPLVFAGRIAPDYFASLQPFYGVGFVLLSVVVVAAAVVLILGIPTFLLLRKFQRMGWTSLAIAGFVLGALPIAALSCPHRLEGYSSGGNWHGKYVDIYINGAPTTYAWLIYGENVMYFGLHGLVGALVFYAVWRKLDRPNISVNQTRWLTHFRRAHV
jgi:hypothetical protein